MTNKPLTSAFGLILADSVNEQIIWLYDGSHHVAVKTECILYCESVSKPKEHTNIYFLDEGNHIRHISSSYGIGKWEKLLTGYKLLRIHKSWLVNYTRLTKVSRQENMAEMKTAGRSFAISRTGRKKLLALMEGRTI